MGSAAVALQAAVGLVALMQMLLSATGMRVSDVLSLCFAAVTYPFKLAATSNL